MRCAEYVLECVTSWQECLALPGKLNLARFNIRIMVDHIKGEGHHEEGSRDAHLRLTHTG